MAGETEDCISLQAECLPTGSISFGRFENESLSWERRSSFSHNRYLEEVEKYSTPGSVTQKKAYFEAHFKKKGLLHQTSSLSQSGSEGHRGDYGIEGATDHMDKTEEDYNESGQYEEFHNHEKDGIQFSWYDESPLASDEIVHEVVDAEGEVTSVSAPIDIVEDVSQFSTVGAFSAEYAPDPSEYDNHAIAKQDDFQINDEAECIKTMTDHTVTYERRDAIQGKALVEADSEPVPVSTKKKSSSKGKSSTERKTSTLISKIQSGVQTARKSSAEKRSASSVATLMLSKDPRKTAKESTVRPTSDRPSSQRVSVSASASRTKKSEPLSKAKGSPVDKPKEKPINRSKPIIDNNLKARKAVATPPEKRVPSTKLSANRADSRASAASFSFKSDERAEKRKEFFMKLEEKLHAKEVQMNEIQARTQEEKDAAMKQFRKSLNFKATPMPSFYHEPSSGVSNGKKAPRTTAKSSKAHLKHEISMNGENNIDESLRIQNSTNLTTLSSDQSSTSREQEPCAAEGCAEAIAVGQDQTTHFGEDSGQDPFSVTATASETAEPAKEDKNKIKLRQQHPQQGPTKSKRVYKISKGTSSSHGKTVKAISGSAGTRIVRVAS